MIRTRVTYPWRKPIIMDKARTNQKLRILSAQARGDDAFSKSASWCATFRKLRILVFKAPGRPSTHSSKTSKGTDDVRMKEASVKLPYLEKAPNRELAKNNIPIEQLPKWNIYTPPGPFTRYGQAGLRAEESHQRMPKRPYSK